MDEMHEAFLKEYERALVEYNRLQDLLRNVLWYNFETIARSWREPWPESFPMTTLCLQGYRFELVKGRGGHMCEKGTFPTYYEGTVENAPKLPPEIVFAELKLAQEWVEECKANCAAPYEWAPGGRLYEKLLRESPGVAAFSSKNLNSANDNTRTASWKCGLLLGDQLERQITPNTKTTAENVLGRIRGDRSLVFA